MESTDLRLFRAVARTGNMTRAAEELHTVQSNVTSRIRGLEVELGVPLLYRHRRGVTLTPAGEQLLPYAAKIESLLEEARQELTSRHGAPRGRLRIGSLETTAGMRLPPVLAAFSKDNPDVDVSLLTGTTEALVAEVLAYRIEGAFVAGPILRGELVQQVIFREELVLVSSGALTDLNGLFASGEEVKVLVFRSGCSYRTRLEHILRGRNVGRFRLMEFGTLDAILGCAAAGIGITLLPKAVVEHARITNEVRIHELPSHDSHADTVFIQRKETFLTPALHRFLECARQGQPASGSPQ